MLKEVIEIVLSLQNKFSQKLLMIIKISVWLLLSSHTPKYKNHQIKSKFDKEFPS